MDWSVIREIERRLKGIEAASVQRDNELLDRLRQAAMAVQRGGLEAVRALQKEFIAVTYDKTLNYSNFIMLGGYAALFTTWQFVRGDLSKIENFLIGLLLGLSVFFFAGYEVRKMIRFSLLFARLNRILVRPDVQEPEKPQLLNAAWVEHSVQESRVWIFYLMPTVLTGFGSGILLLYLMLRSLMTAAFSA